MNGAVAYLWVALGGALGSMARYWVALATVQAWGATFPWGTLVVNIVGSFIIAFFGALTAPHGFVPTGPAPRVFVLVGVCGGFTTFSSFSLQTLELIQSGRWAGAAANVVVSVLVCVAAAAAGFYVASAFGGLPRTEP
jgi:CrcB protein